MFLEYFFLKSHRVFLETARRSLYRNKQQHNSAYMQYSKTCRSNNIPEAKEQIRPAAYANLWHYITQIELYIQNTGYVKVLEIVEKVQ